MKPSSISATSLPPSTRPEAGFLARLKRRPLLSLLAAVVLVLGLFFLFRPASRNASATEFYEVKRGDFTVTVVEGGTLAAVSEVSIRNEVEGTARIIWIVPEGTYVKKGDLLVELDSAQAQDQVNQQQIAYEKAKFAVEQAQAQLEIQKSATNSDYLAAVLKVKFAKIDREKYEQGQRLVDLIEASNRVVQAEAQLAVNLDTYRNSTNLAAKGYETKQKAASDWLAVLNSLNALTVATNTLWLLQNFDSVKSREKYEADVRQAEEELERVVNQNRRKMAQYEADLATQLNTLALNEEKLKRDRKNLEATRIVAPQDGLVVYQVSENRFSSESLIEGGAVVRNRQELIKLPDLSRMKVTVKIHESHVNMIHPGLPAYVMLDSAPDQRYRGVVERVAPLPDTQSRWGNPNLKVYNTEIYLTDTIPNVKPGVSARAEIIVTNIANALSVPIQAVTSYRGTQAVYVVKGGRVEPKPVEIGLYNTKFIEITRGLNEGERVLLSPPFDTQEKDLERGVLADAEKATLSTNVPPPRTDLSGLGPDRTLNGEAAETVAAGEPNGTPGPGRREGFNPEDMLKQFDRNGDGQLDETEREAMRTAIAARFAQGGFGPGGTNAGPGRLSREEMLRQFDKNGDGELDEEERAALRSRFGGGRGPRGGGERSGSEGEVGGGRTGAREEGGRRSPGAPPR